MRLTSPYLYVLLVTALLLPGFHNILGSMEVAVVNGSLLGLASIYLLMNMYRVRVQGIPAVTVLASFGIYFLLVSLSMYIGIQNEVKISFRDIIELHKPALYIVLFFGLSFIFSTQVNAFDSLHRIFVVTIFVLLVFAFMHLTVLSEFFLNVYTKAHNIRSLRVSAPFVNPYDFAFFSAFLAIYFLVLSFNKNFFYLIFFILLVMMMAMTQSRSVFFPFIFLVLFVLAIALLVSNYSKIKKFNIRVRYGVIGVVMVALSILLLVYLYIFYEKYEYLISGLLRIIEHGQLGSAATRVEQLNLAIQLGSKNIAVFMFGYGPAKSVMEHLESAYTFYIFRYGVLGMLFGFIIPYFAALYSLLVKVSRRRKELKSINFDLTCLIFMVLVPVFSIGNNFNEQMRLSVFYILILAIATRKVDRRYEK